MTGTFQLSNYLAVLCNILIHREAHYSHTNRAISLYHISRLYLLLRYPCLWRFVLQDVSPEVVPESSTSVILAKKFQRSLYGHSQ